MTLFLTFSPTRLLFDAGREPFPMVISTFSGHTDHPSLPGPNVTFSSFLRPTQEKVRPLPARPIQTSAHFLQQLLSMTNYPLKNLGVSSPIISDSNSPLNAPSQPTNWSFVFPAN
jgi:hypothetical protein